MVHHPAWYRIILKGDTSVNHIIMYMPKAELNTKNSARWATMVKFKVNNADAERENRVEQKKLNQVGIGH